MKQLILASLITLLAFSTACGLASEPAPEPVASDGIQVHGHWTVTVSNPDGTVDAVHEFENALAGQNGADGAQVLSLLLAGETQINGHAIILYSAGANPVDCEEAGTSAHGSLFIKTITAKAIRDMTTLGTPLTIAGSCTVKADQPSAITMVNTRVGFDSSVDYLLSDNTIISRLVSLFTKESNLSIPVANAQVATINVVISFS